MQIWRQSDNRTQIDAVSPCTRQMKAYRFENASLLTGFSDRPSFVNGLDRFHVNRRLNENADTNETAFELPLPQFVQLCKEIQIRVPENHRIELCINVNN